MENTIFGRANLHTSRGRCGNIHAIRKLSVRSFEFWKGGGQVGSQKSTVVKNALGNLMACDNPIKLKGRFGGVGEKTGCPRARLKGNEVRWEVVGVV